MRSATRWRRSATRRSFSPNRRSSSPRTSASSTSSTTIARRANDVIENILQLSRRERSRPETIDLNAWVLAFVEDYKQCQRSRRGSAPGGHAEPAIEAMVDPQHMQQVAWNLVQNAMRYGRPARRAGAGHGRARLAADKGPPLIEVVDAAPAFRRRSPRRSRAVLHDA